MSNMETAKARIREKITDDPAYQKWIKQDGRKNTFGYRKILRILGQILTGQFKTVRVETKKERKQMRRAQRRQLENNEEVSKNK